MWLSLPRRVSSSEQQNSKVCKVEILEFTPWSHDGFEVAVELLYRYDNDKYLMNFMQKIKQEIVLQDLFCELAQRYVCTLHCTYNVHTYICNLYNADSSQYLPQAIVQFYLDSGLCQHSCTIACDQGSKESITDKNILDESYQLVKHFPDFPLWEYKIA